MDARVFIGRGGHAELEATGRRIDPWRQREEDSGSREHEAFDHPAGYIADPDLAEAVNTALVLGKPLLLTGRPGTGKSLLADRIAWEFNLSPVLRFEAQSMSEAQDLFYRFDIVGQLGAVELARARMSLRLSGYEEANQQPDVSDARPERFVTFGPLGKAILRAAPLGNDDLLQIAFPGVAGATPRDPHPSVVLIDEIDKTSRDFPNDLLNSIERLEFRVRELKDRVVRAADDAALRPIVIITSNSERDLPEPFLRRCTFFHIEDPDEETLRQILLRRVFSNPSLTGSDASPALVTALPPLYKQLLSFFMEYRDATESLSYRPGTSELIDWSRALRSDSRALPGRGLEDNIACVKRAASTIAKHPDDRRQLLEGLGRFAGSAP